MIIIFEDNITTPSSGLLKSCYYGEKIFFSGGSHSLGTMINEFLPLDNLLVFVDVAPNNRYTVMTYRDLNSMFYDEIKAGRLVIMPIVCIEYIILKMLSQYGGAIGENTYIKHLVCNFNYQDASVQSLINSRPKLAYSLEKVFKFVLTDVSKRSNHRCLANGFEYDKNEDGTLVRNEKSIKGIFYDRDCDCDSKYCRLGIQDSLELKAEKLYTSLPLFYVESDKHKEYLRKLGIDTNDCDITEVFGKVQEFYDVICKELGVSSVSISPNIIKSKKNVTI